MDEQKPSGLKHQKEIEDYLVQEIEQKVPASWRTTVAGALAALGIGLQGLQQIIPNLPAWVGMVGTALAAIGVAVLGQQAKDQQVTR